MFSLACVALLSSCAKDNADDYREALDAEIVVALNENVDGIISLIEEFHRQTSVAALSSLNESERNQSCVLYMENGVSPHLYHSLCSDVVSVPEVSIAEVQGEFFWLLDGEFLMEDGTRVSVSDKAHKPMFSLAGEEWSVTYGTRSIVYSPRTKESRRISGLISLDASSEQVLVRFSSGTQISLPKSVFYDQVLTEDVNRCFYKDVFMDAGVGLNPRTSLIAADFLGLSLECISVSSQTAQNQVMVGTFNDANGRLLYPDGQPRYRVLYVNGGDSRSHGSSLGEEGLARIRAFVRNGGAYVGTCAGAFLACNGYDSVSDYVNYLDLWPGRMIHTGLASSSTGMFIEDGSALFSYYRYGGDSYIANVTHNKGGFPVDLPEGTEVLARYDYPNLPAVHNQPSVWAYKEDFSTGRLVMTGSHPEAVTGGERLELMAAMLRYAMDGQGTVPLKGFLGKGITRMMDQASSVNKPSNTRIGDLQCHHFALYIPSSAKNITFQVEASSQVNMKLMLSKDGFAFPDSSSFASEGFGPRQELFIESLDEGIWYLAVQCLTTVTSTNTDIGQDYTGNTDVLDGVAYMVCTNWD